MGRKKERVILVEPDDPKLQVLAERLRAQGYLVDALTTGAEAAALALSAPPSAVVADLWMPGVSGIQLCRLLKSELATESVPVILRGPNDTPRQRFWADHAGAADYVAKGRMGELVRALTHAISTAPAGDGFFQLHPDDVDIRDRISEQLDQALYASVLASEVRTLATCETFPHLFDLFSQFLCRVFTYRWLAVATHDPERLHVHAPPGTRERAIAEARAALQLGGEVPVAVVEDEDASAEAEGPPALCRDLHFGVSRVGRVAVAPVQIEREDVVLMDLVAAELGGPLRIVSLVEQTKHLASHDMLTGLLNRRALSSTMGRDLVSVERRDTATSVLLFDVDHFKTINDTHGHGVGDLVLSAIGKRLQDTVRAQDLAARWGGEEFLVALPRTGEGGARSLADRIRAAIEAMVVTTQEGVSVPVTVSIGVATRDAGEPLDALVERADRAMYEAKAGGRNRVVSAEPAAPQPLALRRQSDLSLVAIDRKAS
ncbi:MAG: diguanylate cyclase [Minicystis sp.]